MMHARECVLSNYSEKTVFGDVKTVLRRVGTSESEWLLEKLSPTKDKLRWILNITEKEDNAWGWYYRGRALCKLGRSINGLPLLIRSANIGFVPAISYLCINGFRDPKLDDTKQFELLCKAADEWDAGATATLVDEYQHRLSPVYFAIIIARRALSFNAWPDYKFRQNSKESYVAGREVEGFPVVLFKSSIEFYLDVTHRARRAALQTTILLVRYVGRDVARLIGKMVYETRDDVEVWEN
jgi:hypothetical protein